MNFPLFRKLVAELRLGKHLRDAVYLHQSAIVAASPVLAVLTERGGCSEVRKPSRLARQQHPAS